MALPSSLQTKDNAQVLQTFVENKRSGLRVERLKSTSSLQFPHLLVIDHSKTGTKGRESYRHLLQVAIVESDGNGGSCTTIVNLTVSVPVNLPVASTAPKDGLAYLADLLTDAGAANTVFDAILQNQS